MDGLRRVIQQVKGMVNPQAYAYADFPDPRSYPRDSVLFMKGDKPIYTDTNDYNQPIEQQMQKRMEIFQDIDRSPYRTEIIKYSPSYLDMSNNGKDSGQTRQPIRFDEGNPTQSLIRWVSRSYGIPTIDAASYLAQYSSKYKQNRPQNTVNAVTRDRSAGVTNQGLWQKFQEFYTPEKLQQLIGGF